MKVVFFTTGVPMETACMRCAYHGEFACTVLVYEASLLGRVAAKLLADAVMHWMKRCVCARSGRWTGWMEPCASCKAAKMHLECDDM